MRKKTPNLVFSNEKFSFVKFIHNYIYNQNDIKDNQLSQYKKIINLVFSIITNEHEQIKQKIHIKIGQTKYVQQIKKLIELNG